MNDHLILDKEASWRWIRSKAAYLLFIFMEDLYELIVIIMSMYRQTGRTIQPSRALPQPLVPKLQTFLQL